MTNVSTLSKLHKSKEHKAAARARNQANGALRASLHQQKANARTPEARATIQAQIDAIGASKRSS